jgi:Phosphate-selective porin O and P
MTISPLTLAVFSCIAGAQNATPPVDPEVVELRERVARLEGKITEMQAADGERWLTEERANDIRGIVQDALADADSRASLQDVGATSGWEKGKGFFIRSADGNYNLNIGGQIQFRWIWNHTDNGPVDDDRYGFESRRIKLWFHGHIVDPTWQYYVEVNGNRSTGGLGEGENVWVQKDLGSGFKIRAGQFKPAFLREEMVSATALQSIERSNVNSMFSAGVTQGIMASYEAEMFRVSASVIDGFNSSGPTAALANWNAEDNEFAGTARIDFLPMGTWKFAANDTGFRDSEPTLLFGAAMAYQKAEYGTGSNGAPPNFNNNETDDFRATLDAMFKTGGWSVAVSGIYRKLETDAGVLVPVDREQLAIVARGGFFVTDDVEIYGLYEWGDLDTAGVPDLSTLTLGATKFFDRHNLKWSNDIGIGFNRVASDWASAPTGWRADSAGKDGQFVFRSQIQLIF